MKKRIALLSLIGLAVFSLSACDTIAGMFDNNKGNNYSYRSLGSGGVKRFDGNAHKADMIYRDYIDNNVHTLSVTPSTETAKLLVIPVWFNDSTEYIGLSKKANVREDIEKAYFGTNAETGWRSVKSYYEEESHGALTITGTVSDWYTPNQNAAYYATDDSDQTKTTAIVKNAVTWFFNNNPSEDRKSYDCDGDGYLDGVMLIYAAPDYQVLNSNAYDNLWAYCYWIQEEKAKSTSKPGANAFFWASFDFMYGRDKSVSRAGNAVYYNGDTSHCELDAHTYIHEMGHMFGLQDYYDYSGGGYRPAGSFSMQDFNVGGHDPFSSYALGWGSAYIPSKTTTISLKPFTTSGEMIILTPEWNTYNSAFDEYLILEYYTSDGLNEFDVYHPYMSSAGKNYPTGSKIAGIRLWHVDARLVYTKTGGFSSSRITSNAKISGYEVTLMCTNSYEGADTGYLSPLYKEDRKYVDYNLLELIHNDVSVTTKNKVKMSSTSLFRSGDTFTMSQYKKQFANGDKLNSGSTLGCSFEVNSINEGYASITISKS